MKLSESYSTTNGTRKGHHSTLTSPDSYQYRLSTPQMTQWRCPGLLNTVWLYKLGQVVGRFERGWSTSMSLQRTNCYLATSLDMPNRKVYLSTRWFVGHGQHMSQCEHSWRKSCNNGENTSGILPGCSLGLARNTNRFFVSHLAKWLFHGSADSQYLRR